MHCDHVLLVTRLLTMLGSADIQIYGDPRVAWKGKSIRPIYRAFSCEVKHFLNPKLQCISTTDRHMSMPLSFFVWSMNGQTRVISGMKKREASMRNLHIVKNVNESWNISSLRIFPVFDRYRLLTLAWTHCFRRSVFSYQINITKLCNVYFASYRCEQITGTKNYDFASSPRAL